MPDFSLSGQEFRDGFLQKEAVRKYPDFDLGVDTRKVALDGFFADESLNAETNRRLSTHLVGNPRVSQILDLACRKAVSILGPWSWDRFEEALRFGPGATTSLKRCEASTLGKLSSTPHVTSSAARIWEVCLQSRPLWLASLDARGIAHYEIHEEDEMIVINKNALTGRTIGKGPDANVIMQLAAGYCMRRRMFKYGINLQDQSINQKRALRGSRTGEIATLDLRSASQSVTNQLVWRFLGNHSADHADLRWYMVLDALRTQSVMVENKVHTYELFSPMGNGATFELETLVFWSLAWATCAVLGVEPDVTCYGDDMIVPSAVAGPLEEVLNHCGLRLNTAKSYSSTEGPLFRESCGSCYLDGLDVSAFYVDKAITSAADIFVLANNIKRWSRMEWGLDGRLQPVWEWVVSHLPPVLKKCRIPFGDTDDGLISDFDESARSFTSLTVGQNHMGFRTWVYAPHVFTEPQGKVVPAVADPLTTIVEVPDVDTSEAYLVAMYRTSYKRFKAPNNDPYVYAKSLGRSKVGSESFEDRPHTYHLKRRVVPGWPNTGPWIRVDA
jgi:hypothetical protein